MWPLCAQQLENTSPFLATGSIPEAPELQIPPYSGHSVVPLVSPFREVPMYHYFKFVQAHTCGTNSACMPISECRISCSSSPTSILLKLDCLLACMCVAFANGR